MSGYPDPIDEEERQEEIEYLESVLGIIDKVLDGHALNTAVNWDNLNLGQMRVRLEKLKREAN